jgi:O-antigen ligase
LLSFLIRPIIDCFWELKFSVFGFRPPEMVSVLVPGLVFVRILFDSNKSFIRSPLALVWIIFISWHVISAAIIMTAGKGAIEALNFFARVFNGFVGFYMLQQFITKMKDFKLLLIVMLIAAITPLSMSIYQNVMGGVIRTEGTIGGLIRNIGFYHDEFTLRLYTLQTFIAILLFWAYFVPSRRSLLTKGYLLSIFFISTFTIYKLFSKAGFLISAVWLLVWTVLRKRILALGIVVLIMVMAVSLLEMSSLEKVETVYSQEVSVVEGSGKYDQSLGGRWSGWRAQMKMWSEQPILMKIAGTGQSATGAHNDFLRALLATGIIGLLIYMCLLILTGLKLIQKCRQRLSPLNIAALMIYLMWCIDAIGLVPGAYSSYQWFAWGFIGLALVGKLDADRDTMDLEKRPENDNVDSLLEIESGNLCD